MAWEEASGVQSALYLLQWRTGETSGVKCLIKEKLNMQKHHPLETPPHHGIPRDHLGADNNSNILRDSKRRNMMFTKMRYGRDSLSQ